MANEKKGLSGILTGLIVFFLVIRIAMIMGRNSQDSIQSNWNSSYLLWSVFVLVVVIVSYFWNQNKKGSDSSE